MTSANAVVQLRTEAALRGRVMALYMAVVTGGTAAGGPVVGWVGETLGARWAILLGSAAATATALVAAAWLARSGAEPAGSAPPGGDDRLHAVRGAHRRQGQCVVVQADHVADDPVGADPAAAQGQQRAVEAVGLRE